MYKLHAITTFTTLKQTIATTLNLTNDYYGQGPLEKKMFFLNETQFINHEECNNRYYFKNTFFFSPPTCESMLFRKSDDTLCQTQEVINNDPHILRTQHGLIYSTAHPITVREHCENHKGNLELSGIGYLKIGPECKLIFQGKIYQGVNFTRKDFRIPNIDLKVGNLEIFTVKKENTTQNNTTELRRNKTIYTDISFYLLLVSAFLTILNLIAFIKHFKTPKSIQEDLEQEMITLVAEETSDKSGK